MSDRRSLGPVQVFGTDLFAINDAFRQLSERVDSLKGLRGRSEVFDRQRVDDPTEAQDAINLGEAEDTFVAQVAGRMTYATDHWKYTDTNGTDLHGAGNV